MPALTRKQFDEYKRCLDRDGYVVVKGLVDPARAENYASKFWDYLEGLSVKKKIDRNKPETWKGPHWPFALHGILKHYNVGHQQFVWDVRDEDGIVSFFEHLWDSKDLLTSFDGACMIRSSATAQHATKSWAHTDQAPVIKITETQKDGTVLKSVVKRSKDFSCYQGLLNLRPCGLNDGGLTVYKGSHKHHYEFFKNKGAVDKDSNVPTLNKSKQWKDATDNWYKLDEDNAYDRKFLSQFEKIKVCAEPGDFLVFCSKTIHYASGINPNENTDPKSHRMCVYVSMLPKRFATAADLKKKEQHLRGLRTTSHWACAKIKVNPQNPRELYSDSSNFIVPTTPPVLTKRMKRLAGVSDAFKFDVATSGNGMKRKHTASTSRSDSSNTIKRYALPK